MRLEADLEGRRILGREDDPDTAELLRLLIEKRGFAVDVARTAAEAKEMLARNGYAAATLGLSLPGGSGLDLVRELRAEERHRDLPLAWSRPGRPRAGVWSRATPRA